MRGAEPSSAGSVISSRDNGLTFQKTPDQKAVTWSTVLPTSNGALLLGEVGVAPYVARKAP